MNEIEQLRVDVGKLFALVNEQGLELKEMRKLYQEILEVDELDDDEAVVIVDDELDPLEASHRRFVLKLDKVGSA